MKGEDPAAHAGPRGAGDARCRGRDRHDGCRAGLPRSRVQRAASAPTAATPSATQRVRELRPPLRLTVEQRLLITVDRSFEIDAAGGDRSVALGRTGPTPSVRDRAPRSGTATRWSPVPRRSTRSRPRSRCSTSLWRRQHGHGRRREAGAAGRAGDRACCRWSCSPLPAARACRKARCRCSRWRVSPLLTRLREAGLPYVCNR